MQINCGECKENIPIAYQEKTYEVAIYALKEIQQYREIGTVEECREAVAKQKPKVPDYEGDGYADGYMVYDTWICPNCGKKYEVDYDDYKHCPECGQAIDENLEGMEMSDFYKPLTPSLRKEINVAIENQIRELETCEKNAFVNAQIVGLNAQKNLINALPDGYPIPCTKYE